MALNQVVGRDRRRARMDLNAQGYINTVLQPHVLPFVQQHPGTTLMKDTARPYITRMSINFLNQNGNSFKELASYASDLNPIEHLWDVGSSLCSKRSRVRCCSTGRMASDSTSIHQETYQINETAMYCCKKLRVDIAGFEGIWIWLSPGGRDLWIVIINLTGTPDRVAFVPWYSYLLRLWMFCLMKCCLRCAF